MRQMSGQHSMWNPHWSDLKSYLKQHLFPSSMTKYLTISQGTYVGLSHFDVSWCIKKQNVIPQSCHPILCKVKLTPDVAWGLSGCTTSVQQSRSSQERPSNFQTFDRLCLLRGSVLREFETSHLTPNVSLGISADLCKLMLSGVCFGPTKIPNTTMYETG